MTQNVYSIIDTLNHFEELYFQIKDVSLSNEQDDGQDDDIDKYELTKDIEEENQRESSESDSNNDAETNYSNRELEVIDIIHLDNWYYHDENTRFSPLVNDWVTEDDYESDCYFIVNEFLSLILELRESIWQGQIKLFNLKVLEAQELLNNEFLSNILISKLGQDSDDINNLLLSIVEKINFTEFFENEIYSLPNNILDLTEEIIFQISKNPQLIYNLEPRLFEELIRKIFVKFKLNASLTKQTRDGGYDIIAFEDNLFSNNSYIIECKRYSPDGVLNSVEN